MKSLKLVLLVSAICFGTYLILKEEINQEILIQIVDSNEEELWSTKKSINSIQDISKVSIGEEIPLFESYLSELDAEKVLVFSVKKSGYQIIKSFEITDLIQRPFLQNPEQNHKVESISPKKSKIYESKKASAIEHWEWRMLQKGGNLDPEKVIAARKFIEQNADTLPKNHSYLRDAGLRSWNFMGPGNIGGRISTIAIKGGGRIDYEIFAGSSGGGIWRSTNSGNSWTPVDDFLPSLGVSSIVIDPQNEQIMYAATGKWGVPGAGIYKSINGGSSWSELTLPNVYHWIFKLAIHPTSGRLFAVIVNGTKEGADPNSGAMIYSDNGGISWTWVNTLLPSFTPGLTDIDINPQDPDLVTLSGYGAFWRSTDGGNSFSYEIGGTDQLPTSAYRIEIGMANNASVMYALVNTSVNQQTPYNCALYKTTNAGATWIPCFTDSMNVFPKESFGSFASAIWVDPLDQNQIFFGGVDIWRSNNGGTTATRKSDWKFYHNAVNPDSFSLHADQHFIIEAPNYSALNRRVFFGNDGGVQKTDNITTVKKYDGWDNLCNTTFATTQFYSGAVAVDGSPFGGGSQDNGFSIGSSPFNWDQPVTGDGAFMAFSKNNENKIYANTNYNRLYQSLDGGQNWAPKNVTEIPVGMNTLINQRDLSFDNARLISTFVIDPDNDAFLYMGAERLWRYQEAQDSIFEIKSKIDPNEIETITSIDAAPGKKIFVGYTDGTIEYTLDGGQSWSGDISISGMPDNFVTDIAIKPGTNLFREAIVSIAGYNTDNVWLHTYSRGASQWTNISLPFAIQVNSVTYNPANHNWIYVGTDLGIFASEDKGQTWSITPIYGSGGNEYGNEGPAYTEVTDLFWSGDGAANGPYRLWATTYGRGLWRSNFVLDKIYVDKDNGSIFGDGTISNPYKFLRDAANAAGNGATIVFLSENDHDEVPSSIILDKRIILELNSGPVVIK